MQLPMTGQVVYASFQKLTSEIEGEPVTKQMLDELELMRQQVWSTSTSSWRSRASTRTTSYSSTTSTSPTRSSWRPSRVPKRLQMPRTCPAGNDHPADQMESPTNIHTEAAEVALGTCGGSNGGIGIMESLEGNWEVLS